MAVAAEATHLRDLKFDPRNPRQHNPLSLRVVAAPASLGARVRHVSAALRAAVVRGRLSHALRAAGAAELRMLRLRPAAGWAGFVLAGERAIGSRLRTSEPGLEAGDMGFVLGVAGEAEELEVSRAVVSADPVRGDVVQMQGVAELPSVIIAGHAAALASIATLTNQLQPHAIPLGAAQRSITAHQLRAMLSARTRLRAVVEPANFTRRFLEPLAAVVARQRDPLAVRSAHAALRAVFGRFIGRAKGVTTLQAGSQRSRIARPARPIPAGLRAEPHLCAPARGSSERFAAPRARLDNLGLFHGTPSCAVTG